MPDQKLDLETAIMEMVGDSRLLVMAAEDCLTVQTHAWTIVGKEPVDGVYLLWLTEDQFNAFNHACYRVLKSAKHTARVFHGEPLRDAR